MSAPRTRARRALVGATAALTGLVMLTGCTQTVDGVAAKSGSGEVPRNNDSQRRYPNLLKECDVLTEDVLAETVGADPLDIQGTARVSANVAGLGPYSELAVELLDEQFHPLPGFSGEDAAVLTDLEGEAAGDAADLVPGDVGEEQAGQVPGLRVPIEWDKGEIPTDKGPVRLKVDFRGVRPEDTQLYALYVEAG